MFAVDDVDDVVARLRSHGAELVGEIAQYEDIYRLCFLRGPEGIIIGLAEQLSCSARCGSNPPGATANLRPVGDGSAYRRPPCVDLKDWGHGSRRS